MGNSSNIVEVLRYQEMERNTLSHARDSFVISPLHSTCVGPRETRKPPGSNNTNNNKKKTLCEVTGCKEVNRVQTESREAETDVAVDLTELIAKIQELKKNVDTLEAIKRNATLVSFFPNFRWSHLKQSWAVLRVLGYFFGISSTGISTTEYLKYLKSCVFLVQVYFKYLYFQYLYFQYFEYFFPSISSTEYSKYFEKLCISSTSVFQVPVFPVLQVLFL